jgi:putative sterol carrier protein
MTPEELTAILEDFRLRAHENKIVLKMLKDWTRNIHVTATDLDARTWTMVIDNGRIVRVALEAVEPRDIHIQALVVALAGIFRGELNPAKEFAKGNLKFIGSNKDEMRLDAIIQYLWE